MSEEIKLYMKPNSLDGYGKVLWSSLLNELNDSKLMATDYAMLENLCYCYQRTRMLQVAMGGEVYTKANGSINMHPLSVELTGLYKQITSLSRALGIDRLNRMKLKDHGLTADDLAALGLV